MKTVHLLSRTVALQRAQRTQEAGAQKEEAFLFVSLGGSRRFEILDTKSRNKRKDLWAESSSQLTVGNQFILVPMSLLIWLNQKSDPILSMRPISDYGGNQNDPVNQESLHCPTQAYRESKFDSFC